jgi:hypothetical protein
MQLPDSRLFVARAEIEQNPQLNIDNAKGLEQIFNASLPSLERLTVGSLS